ncbi:pyruvate dehydrogenase E1 component subunit alpha, somatic form, mitochondrial-like [Saccostrea echinata]|uniref:pyruvate dehydrogenase E1 component subunit alpha, somatic form, mitochondrial-like n=1 Tax=Saccostrea echinata TaxID=191078 RepID=UPI002A8183D9|nr:pyruvate dehydrogenase E1 component subunit alpha, somatic form, mitochondrial-like [Saccostrea echinata]
MYLCAKSFQRIFVQGFSRRGFAKEAVFEIEPYQLHRLDTGPSTRFTLTRKDALGYFKMMTGMRETGDAAQKLFDQNYIRGLLHLCSGMEAVRAGVEAAITSEDILVGTYRIHGWAYARGIPVEEILAEFLGKSTGRCKGKGGAMHLYSRNMLGGNGIIGATVPLGTGVGFAMKYKKKPNVSISVYGEGAANQGQIFEAFNMAKLWNLPCIYLCDNNVYSISTIAERVSAITEFYTRGDYIPGLRVDGMDILAVREAFVFAKRYALENGPILVETMSYRYNGHSAKDEGLDYRKKDEIEHMKQTQDPIENFKERILKENLTDETELKHLVEEVTEEIQIAAEKVKEDKEPHRCSLYEDVYQTEDYHT